MPPAKYVLSEIELRTELHRKEAASRRQLEIAIGKALILLEANNPKDAATLLKAALETEQ